MADGSASSFLTLGLDVGTSGVKALLRDAASGAVVARGSAAYGLLPTDVPGRAEQDPQDWIRGIIAAVRQAIAGVPGFQPAHVRAVGVSGQQHGLVVLDAQHKVLRPAKLWCDVESAPEAAELSKALGIALVPSFTVTKLLWLKRHEPAVMEQVAHVLLPHDFVNWWLCGRLCMEAGDASGTGLLDVRTRRWDPVAIGLIDERLSSWLPNELISPNQVIGHLTPAAADALGLHTAVAVSPGSGDNAMAALGAGLVAAGPMILSLGTSGTLFGSSPAPLLDPTGAVCPFCNATGGGLPLLCTLNCAQPLQEVADAFGLSHAELTDLAALEAPGCCGVTFLPYLIGERTPNWPNATGSLLGLRPGLLRPGLLYRAAMEGVTFSLLAGAKRMAALGLTPTALHLVGGGANNILWRQMVADVFQLPVRLPAELESAALGAALQAAACYQGIDVSTYVAAHPPPLLDTSAFPDPGAAAAYEAVFARFTALGTQLHAPATA